MFFRWLHIGWWLGLASGVFGAAEAAAPPASNLPLLDTVQAVRALTPVEAQWVEVRGVVRDVKPDNGHALLLLYGNGGHFNVIIQDVPPASLPLHLVDARVLVKGVNATVFNEQEQSIGASFYVPSLDQIQILDPAPPEPFHLSVQPINSLWRFNPKVDPERRVKIQGVVTLPRDTQSVYLQDESGGILVQTRNPIQAKPGDKIEVVGFSTLGDYQPRMQHALFRKTGTSALPTPLPVGFKAALQGKYNSQLVTLEARLLDWHQNNEALSLKTEAGVFNAYFLEPPAPHNLEDWPLESLLRLTGVCVVLVNELRQPAVFRLLVASAREVQLLQRPPWWSQKHTQQVLSLLSLGILAAMGWVVLLRQRVRKQTEHIRRQFDKESALAEQLRQAQKMESVGQLAAGIAHDFNNLLTVIQGRAKILQTQLPPDPKTAASLREIEAASGRAANLTRQLLTFSRKQQMQPRPLNLNEVISDVAKMLQRALGEHINLQFNYAPHLPIVYADTGMMEQVIMNLSVNARDAMPKGGQLQLRTQVVNLDPSVVDTRPEARPGQFVCLSVSDTGCGMAPETASRIFEPFFTTKDPGKGTGLGLAIVHGIVKQHEGWIEVQTELGQGSTFKIFLPGSNHLLAPNNVAPAKPALRNGTETILVVEDEAPLRDLMRAILEQHGYHVLEAGSGPEALTVWQQQRRSIDLLLTDLVMPDGITGHELAERLQENKPSLKVVYTSGYSMDLFEAGFSLRVGPNFVAKPFSQDQLLRTIRNCLDGVNQN